MIARLALLAGLLAGCGFDRPAPFAGARLPAVAAWEDLGPVVVCDGSVRLGSEGARAAGLCGDPATALRACTRDADCASRERCTCAGCQVALCDGSDECGAGQVCTFADRRCDRPCARDGECAGGELCLPGAGVCRGRCAADGDCQGGERCDGSRCVTDPCVGDSECALACRFQRVPERLREPSPLLDGDRLVLYLERGGILGAPIAIYRAASPPLDGSDEDGRLLRLDPRTPVIAPALGDGNRAGAPSVIRQGGGLVVAFADGMGRLRRADGSDGVSFTVALAPLLAPRFDWDAAGLDGPSLAPAPDGSGLLLYYGTADRAAIGLAASSDGALFAPRPAPVLTPAAVSDPLLWRGLDAIASPFAERPGGDGGEPRLRLYFAARGRESASATQFGMQVPEAPNFSIGEAGTLDGASLVPYPFDPVFDRVQSFLVHPSELDPAVIALPDGRRLLYYRAAAADESRPQNLRVAKNPPSVR